MSDEIDKLVEELWDKAPRQATPDHVIRTQVMDSRIQKNEREWWAKREIESLASQLQQEREANARKNQALNDLTTERNLLARDIKLERKTNARLREAAEAVVYARKFVIVSGDTATTNDSVADSERCVARRKQFNQTMESLSAALAAKGEG